MQVAVTRFWVLLIAYAITFSLTKQTTLGATIQSAGPAVEPSSVATTQPGKADGAWNSDRSPVLTGERRPLYRLNKSDVVELQFPFSPELNETVSVLPDGLVPLKNTLAIVGEGKSVPELEEAIRDAYRGVLHDPEVTVVLREFDKPYFIAAGEVVRPGKYELRSDTTVTEALAIAGGLTGRAKHSQVVLFRRSSDDLIETHLLDVKSMLHKRDLGEDLHLRPGDMLYAPQNFMSKLKPFMPASAMSLYLNPTQF
jgi:polysaccharide export outer membrane protein